MADRSDQFRSKAMDCLALARSTADPVTRANLLTLAQKWFNLANGPTADFDAVLQEFNDQQMTRPMARPDDTPVMQQQQQLQPKKDEEA